MTERTQTLQLTATVDLVATGVGINHHILQHQSVFVVPVFNERCHMGPDDSGVLTGIVVLAMSGIKQEHLIHLAVVVPVVVLKLHLIRDSTTSLLHQFSHILVEPARRISPVDVLTVIGMLMLGLDGTYDIEHQIELSVTLSMEIVADTTWSRMFSIAPEVGNIVPGLKRVFILEFGICELHEDDQSPLLTQIGFLLGCLLEARPCSGALFSHMPASKHRGAAGLPFLRKGEKVKR